VAGFLRGDFCGGAAASKELPATIIARRTKKKAAEAALLYA
jgi:hypothetical protein